MARERTIAARDKERLIREVQREIRPLADGLAERTKLERVERLRNNVRRNKKMSTRLQALARAVVCRAAVARLLTRGVDQWQLLECDLSGEPYYFNEATQQSRWTRPLELDYGVALEQRDFCLRGRLGAVVRDARAAGLLGGPAGDDQSIPTVQTSAILPSDGPDLAEFSEAFS